MDSEDGELFIKVRAGSILQIDSPRCSIQTANLYHSNWLASCEPMKRLSPTLSSFSGAKPATGHHRARALRRYRNPHHPSPTVLLLRLPYQARWLRPSPSALSASPSIMLNRRSWP